MGYYDPIRKVAIRDDGSIAYATGFGTVTTIQPFTKEDSWNLQEQRRTIQKMDTQSHGWRR